MAAKDAKPEPAGGAESPGGHERAEGGPPPAYALAEPSLTEPSLTEPAGGPVTPTPGPAPYGPFAPSAFSTFPTFPTMRASSAAASASSAAASAPSAAADPAKGFEHLPPSFYGSSQPGVAATADPEAAVPERIHPPTRVTGRAGGSLGRSVVVAVVSFAAGAALTALVLWDDGPARTPVGAASRQAGRDAGPASGTSPKATSHASTSGTGQPGAVNPSGPAARQGRTSAGTTIQARTVLRAFIRGIGNGDPTVCDRFITASYAARAYGSVDMCRKDVVHVTERYRPLEVQAMRTISVPRGFGSNGAVTVRFADLVWTRGHMTAETVQKRFVLRNTGGGWKIVA